MSSKVYKTQVKPFHDKRTIRKQFIVGNNVLLYDSWIHLFVGKLQFHWVCPYIMHKDYFHRAMEIEDPNKESISKNNAQWLKPFIEGFDIVLVPILFDIVLGSNLSLYFFLINIKWATNS